MLLNGNQSITIVSMKILVRALAAVAVLLGLLTPMATADTNPDGSPKGIPGIDYPIIPGVNAPFATYSCAACALARFSASIKS